MLSGWLVALGGSGIVVTLGGVLATFIRVGRLLERIDSIEDRLDRLERWQDGRWRSR